MGALGNGLFFLVKTLFDLYLLVLVLCVLLRASGAHFFNPIIQVLVKLTDFLLKPARKMIPSHKVDWAGWLIVFVVKIIELVILLLITGSYFNVAGIIILAVTGILSLIINIYFFAIIIQAIMSWFPQAQAQATPIAHVLYHLNEPLLKPARRFIPTLSGIDFSPLVVIIVLQLINIVIIAPINAYGLGLFV